MGGSTQVYLEAEANRLNYPTKTLIPVLRGWNVTNPNGLVATITTGIQNWTVSQSKGLVADLTADITAVKNAGANGYAIFTYESLRKATGSNLADLSKKIGY